MGRAEAKGLKAGMARAPVQDSQDPNDEGNHGHDRRNRSSTQGCKESVHRHCLHDQPSFGVIRKQALRCQNAFVSVRYTMQTHGRQTHPTSITQTTATHS